MNRIDKRMCMAALGVLLMAVPAGAESPQELKTQKDKLSYTIGVDTARALRQQEIEVDIDVLIKGLKDGTSGEKLMMTEPEIRAVRTAAQADLMRKQTMKKQQKEAARKTAGEENRKAGEAFLAGNRNKEGVVTLPSGLQYKVLKTGAGKTPSDDSTVEVEYRGTLIDGTEFSSSYVTGRPATMKVKGVIPGWAEALKLMPEGSRWQLFIPPQLAYAERGAGEDIGPNATLLFEIELLAVK